jgi:peptidoglycan/LPS O-acetylase OafA/YrhL
MQRLWFKAKTYGWGWTPATWQGWLVTLAYIAAVFAAALIFLRPKLAAAGWIGYGTAIVLLTAALIIVCYRTGERPQWRWGEKMGRGSLR